MEPGASGESSEAGGPVLDVGSLCVDYHLEGTKVAALRGVDLRLEAGGALALVGLSGSGKSSLGLALMGLLPSSARVSGRALVDGEDMLALSPTARRERCGRTLSMVFQEPATALNPVLRVDRQIVEALRRRVGGAPQGTHGEVGRLLEEVGLPAEIATAYPHQLSGGQRQRVLIAMAIAPRPKLLIADEPTTALDVLTEASILELLTALRRSSGLALLLVSHDLRAVRRVCERVVVLHQGQVVEQGALGELLRRPRHPRTRELVAALDDPSGADDEVVEDG